MKYILVFLAGMAGSLFVLIILAVIESLFNLIISDFLIGWMSCVGFVTGMKIGKIIKEIEFVQ